MSLRGISFWLRTIPLLMTMVGGIALSTSAAWAQGSVETSEDKQIERLLIRGLTRLYLEDYKGAASALQEGLKIRPESPALLSSMARAREGLKELGAARFYLQQALAGDPGNADIWLSLADVCMKAGDAAGSVHALTESVRIEPQNVTVQLELIQLLIRLEQYTDAHRAAVGAVLQAGKEPLILSELALVLERLGRTEEAIDVLTTLTKFEPEEVDHRIRLGAAHMQRGDWASATDQYRMILTLDPDHTEAARSLAVGLRRLDRPEEAESVLKALTPGQNGERDLRQQLDIDPNNSSAIAALAALLSARNQPREAAILYRRHTDLKPRTLDSWIAGIRAFVDAGNPEEALAFAETGLTLFPGYIPILIEKARALYAVGRVENALILLDELERRATDPTHVDAISVLISEIRGS